LPTASGQRILFALVHATIDNRDGGGSSVADAQPNGRASTAMSTFDERAREWDTPERRKRAQVVAESIRANVALGPAMRVVDVGAGTGLLGLTLAGDVGEMVLAEPSEGMLEVAREKLAAEGPMNASALRFDLLADPPPANRFDLAVSLLVLHHLRDTGAALNAIRELLRPGGRLALADLDTEDGSFHDPEAEGIHHLGFDREELAALARKSGFVDVELRTAAVIESDGRQYPVFLLLAANP
jgi:ubiquinone/menaquinone biosynthesis C-methylase UbiE